jgi:hypothetical protein
MDSDLLGRVAQNSLRDPASNNFYGVAFGAIPMDTASRIGRGPIKPQLGGR